MRTRRVDSLFVTDAEDVLLGMLSVEAINQVAAGRSLLAKS